jgi:UrcA family protein
MRKMVTMSAAGVLVASVLGGSAIAQTQPEVVVQTQRMAATTIGRTATGIPILNISMGYTVSAKGLDLSSHAGALAFERRVSDAALAACKEIGRQYPNSTPPDAECAKVATDKAMVKVHELEAAAQSSK